MQVGCFIQLTPFKDSAPATGSTFRLVASNSTLWSIKGKTVLQILCCSVGKLKSASMLSTINTAHPRFIPQQRSYWTRQKQDTLNFVSSLTTFKREQTNPAVILLI